MKIISLLPIKNEAWILDAALKNLSAVSDHIIVADQQSTDGSREICSKYPKVILIDNNETGHSNKVRWLLLDEARKIPGNNLILCVDADEMIPLSFFEKKQLLAQLAPGDILEFKWVQLWKSIHNYRDDGVWKDSYKQIGFIDDRTSDYARTFVINDHTNRIPNLPGRVHRAEEPLLHLQFVPWKRTQVKQAWYRCSERIAKTASPRKINHRYQPTLDTRAELIPTPPAWLTGLHIPDGIEHLDVSWHYNEILTWFDTYGIEFFEPLEIWHIPEFKERFVAATKREPKPSTYPPLLIAAKRLVKKILK